MVYPKENIKVVDRYNYEIKLTKIQLAQWFIVPIYRRAHSDLYWPGCARWPRLTLPCCATASQARVALLSAEGPARSLRHSHSRP